jgi:hypothetical protein
LRFSGEFGHTGATERPFGCGSDGMSADLDLAPDRRVGVRLSGTLRSVGNPGHHRASRRRTVYLCNAAFGPNARS